MKKQKLHQKIADKRSRKLPDIPKSYFLRDHVPPPTMFEGEIENRKHYRYKIFTGETIRDNLSYIDVIQYDYQAIPDFFNARYDRYLSYLPDIYIKFVDDPTKIVYVADIEINGGFHYKNKNQILKNKERLNTIYPYLCKFRELGKEDYFTIASYIVFDIDDFEYSTIDELFDIFKDNYLQTGGVYPRNYDKVLTNLLRTAN